jgi:ActD protein
MSRRLLIASFTGEDDLLAAVRELRRLGHVPAAIHSPYAVHGLERAAGLAPTRLPVVCALFGFSGAAAAFAFQAWVSAVDWRLDVGGKPFNSLPAFVPVIFEVGVLLAGLGTVAVFLLRSRLYPGRRASLPLPRLTDDRFVVVLEERSATFDAVATRRLLDALGADRVEERIVDSPGRPGGRRG